ncbi:MAG: SRPBCC domain-containing protein [Opitutaceae bacterium]|nr:SRPBCC domain-containing protein [Opitutaceae bacterium]
MKISIEVTVTAPSEEGWRTCTAPDDINQWTAASDDWHATAATADLRAGGAFSSRIKATDVSFGFDFLGTYKRGIPRQLIEMEFGGRGAVGEFIPRGQGVVPREPFAPGQTRSIELQQGWQASLDRFARRVGARWRTFGPRLLLENTRSAH